MSAQALITLDPKTILSRYEAGEPIKDIAKSLSVSKPAMYMFLLRKEPELWKELSSAHALAELEQAEEDTLAATDKLTLARANSRADHAKWKLERLLRRYFGQDHAVQAGPGVQINVNISPRSEQVIEIKPESTDKVSVAEGTLACLPEATPEGKK